MPSFEIIKKQQIEEETHFLDELVRAKLDALFQELQLLARTTALKQDIALGVLVGGFSEYCATLAVETETPREEFLADMGMAYDEAADDVEIEAAGDNAKQLEAEEEEETELKEPRQTSGLPPS